MMGKVKVKERHKPRGAHERRHCKECRLQWMRHLEAAVMATKCPGRVS